MSFQFSENSKKRLKTCNSKLQVLLNFALKTSNIDFTVACGYRGKEEQEKAYEKGLSKAKFGQSKHNVKPSMAVDIYPYDGRMCNGDKKEDIEKFKELADHIKKCANRLQIKIKWGGDFKSFKDLPHWELV